MRDESINWTSVNAKVISSEVKRNQGTQYSLTDYCANVDYSYSVKGKDYSGYTIRFTGWCYLSRVRAQRDVDLYPIGEDVLVYFDPDIPEDSVLEPGGRHWSEIPLILFYLIPGVFGSILILNILRFMFFKVKLPD
jgi:hypothetical protein